MGLGDLRAEAKGILKQVKADLRDVMAQCKELAAENARLKDRNMWLEREIMRKDHQWPK